MKINYIVCGLLALAVAFAFGRYTAPKQPKEVEIVKVKDTKVVTQVIKNPDGTVITTTTNETHSNTSVDKKSAAVLPSWKVDALAGVDTTNVKGGIVYGVGVSKQFIGPVSLGVWGLTNGVVGASVGITF